MATVLLSSLALNAVQETAKEGSFWSKIPENLFEVNKSGVSKSCLVIAGASLVGVSAVVAKKKYFSKSEEALEYSMPLKLYLPNPIPSPELEGNCETQGASIHYELFGTGPKKLLFLSGFAATGALLEDVVSMMLKDPEYQICTFDYRCSGKSTGDVQRLTSKALAQDALALLDHLGWDKAHILGVSLGGCVATELALAAPNRVASLFLSATTGGKKYSRVPFGPKMYSLLFKPFINMEHGKLVDMLLEQQYSKPFLDAMSTDEAGALTSKSNRDLLRDYFMANFERLCSFNSATVSSMAGVVTTHFVSDQQIQALANGGFKIVLHRNTGDCMDPNNVGALRLENILKSSPQVTPLVFQGAGHWGLREDLPRFVAALKNNCSDIEGRC